MDALCGSCEEFCELEHDIEDEEEILITSCCQSTVFRELDADCSDYYVELYEKEIL